jgi:hypothetical protein
MKRKTKPQNHGMLLAILAAFAVLILLLRMMVFVSGHPRHHF